MTCYLIRHGKDDEAVRGGWSKSCLSDEGIAQAKNLSKYILEHKDVLRIEKIFSSDLPRAAQTATSISEALNLEIALMPEFRETNNGVLAGMQNEIADKLYPGLYWSALEWNEAYPQGESPCAFYERIKTAWEHFSEKILEDGKNVALFTHAGVINVIYTLIDGTIFSNKEKTKPIPYVALIPLNYIDGKWSKATEDNHYGQHRTAQNRRV